MSRDILPDYEYERNCVGELKTEVLYVRLSECKIIFMLPDGAHVPSGNAQGESKMGDAVRDSMRMQSTYIRGCGFLIEHPDIDPLLVKSIEIKMDYAEVDFALVKIEMYVGKLIEPASGRKQ